MNYSACKERKLDLIRLVQRKKNRMNLAKLLLAAAFLTFLVIVIVIISRPKTKTDFSKYASVEEVQLYLDEKVLVGKTTSEHFQQWILVEGIRDCITFEQADINYKNADNWIRCTVIAPHYSRPNRSWWETLLGRIVESWYYELDFIFENDLLIEARVWKSSLSF